MAAVLPPVPKLIFTILEPVSLIAGAVAPLIDPSFFVSTQLAHVAPHPLLPVEHVLALQLGNLYFLMCLVGLFVLNTTTEARVVHGYIWALWIADIGHVGATAYLMGYDNFVNVGAWNAMAMGNIGATSILFAARTMYMLGIFGPDKVPSKGRKAL